MRFAPVLALVLLPRLGAAQTPDSTQGRPGAAVAGVVRDSVARTSLVGAIVQLAAAAPGAPAFVRASVSDSLGRFSFGGVPDGRYMLGFLHPLLDSLGVEPVLREVLVNGGRDVRIDLATPSPARLRAAVCGSTSGPESGGVLIGTVRNALDGAPAAGVKVTGEWLEISFRADGLSRRVPRLVATTAENGWFAMCNVPKAGTMSVIASRGADSTDVIEVLVPAEGFLRRELYLGASRTVMRGDTTQRADSLAPEARRMHVGDGRISGTVIAAAGGNPLPNAQVSIIDGPQTRANQQGEWTLSNAPSGTRMLEVRALGYYPERRRVDVVTGVAPVRVALSTLKAVLDTVRIRATRLTGRMDTGFEERRRKGVGTYLGPVELARHQLVVTSDLFRNLSGIRMEYDADRVDKIILIRSSFGYCLPSFYLNGLYLARGVSADDLDSFVRPNTLAAVEIYTEASTPPQFQGDLNGCGSIVIWTK